MIFHDWSDFAESVRYWLTPDIISLFKGEFVEDWWETMKFLVFVGICTALVAAEYGTIRYFIPSE